MPALATLTGRQAGGPGRRRTNFTVGGLPAHCAAGCATTSAAPSTEFDDAEVRIELQGDGETKAPVGIDGSVESYVDQHCLPQRNM